MFLLLHDHCHYCIVVHYDYYYSHGRVHLQCISLIHLGLAHLRRHQHCQIGSIQQGLYIHSFIQSFIRSFIVVHLVFVCRCVTSGCLLAIFGIHPVLKASKEQRKEVEKCYTLDTNKHLFSLGIGWGWARVVEMPLYKGQGRGGGKRLKEQAHGKDNKNAKITLGRSR